MLERPVVRHDARLEPSTTSQTAFLERRVGPRDISAGAGLPHCIGTARTETSTCSPVGSSALPIKPPDIGSACPASLVTPTRIRFAPATRPFVGSYSTQPAPGR